MCYAFTQLAGGRSPNSILTVSHRPDGRNQVAVRLDRRVRRNADVIVTAGSTSLRFYTAQGTAFARDGNAAIAAFRRGQNVVVRSPAANGRGTVSNTYSLSGFSAAYNAISRECPPAAGRRVGSSAPRRGT
ncbi:invasion associated locus B family protein [Muricoccus radiodurans]|uniref:invasion associated locus B family protein n=1 Tax=Muricoccus radiodurans TaxID=2231721 RepID=UPI003CF4BBEC